MAVIQYCTFSCVRRLGSGNDSGFDTDTKGSDPLCRFSDLQELVVIYEAFQHFFDGFPKSVTWLRSNNSIGMIFVTH